ncbi:MAG: hypothetical protein AB7P02_05290 [Alphaproteobacteria bacterium]
MTGDDVAAIEASMTPADPAVVVRLLARTMAVLPPPDGNARLHTEACIEALDGAPIDLVVEALRRVRLECTFCPRPAEIRRRVEAAVGERKRAVAKARVAASRQRHAPAVRTPPTDEDRAAVTALLDEAIRGKRMGGHAA